MAKRSWFNIVKRFFVSETQSKQKNKEKRRKWIFGKLKIKRLASLTAPSPLSPLKQRTQNEAEEEQSRHALTVAIASTAAAHAAAEVVRITGTPQSSEQCLEEEKSLSIIIAQNEATKLAHQCERQAQESAAVKIQTAFRGYLAKKALRALKGIVKLQAIIRGRAVRRQAMTTLKCLQSIINIQSHACARRFQTIEDAYHCDEHNQFQNLRDKIIRMDSNSQRRWDGSLISKEDAEALFLSKKEAMLKRERIREYSYTHRKSAESERNKVKGRWRYWLDQWVDTQLSKSKELEDLDTVLDLNAKRKEEFGGKQLRLRNFQRQNIQIEGMDSPVFVPRRSSYHRKQCSLGDENSFTTSPVVPTYMAATKSAKAKARSLSSPKLRAGSLDTYSESYSPCKNNISLISSITSEVPISSTGKILGKSSSIQQRSPSMKGLPSPLRLKQTTKDRSFDWDRQSAFR
ncbi:protein IQ-DOMAIN 14 [Prunus avium]|uniref:Protein IQ-DOMAIN 14 n=1 Tax=Prunus avium TaxID=42229 RepID=A0A6P5RH50_PRUAV|nr:protein IQ-DOMAIN 14 [Prunus avium]